MPGYDQPVPPGQKPFALSAYWVETLGYAILAYSPRKCATFAQNILIFVPLVSGTEGIYGPQQSYEILPTDNSRGSAQLARGFCLARRGHMVVF